VSGGFLSAHALFLFEGMVFLPVRFCPFLGSGLFETQM